jgi:hypothetical protein
MRTSSQIRSNKTDASAVLGWRGGRARLPELSFGEIGRPHLRLRNPNVGGYLEGLAQPLYDIYRIAVATAAPIVRTFSVAQGGNYALGGVTSFQKTLLHTNLTQNGQLEAGKTYITKAVKIILTGGPQAAPSSGSSGIHPYDALNFAYSTVVRFQVNSYDYLITQPSQLPAGGGLSISGAIAIYDQSTATVDGIMVPNLGRPDARNVFELPLGGVTIEEIQNFTVLLDPTQESTGAFTTVSGTSAVAGFLGTGINAWVVLDGVQFRTLR